MTKLKKLKLLCLETGEWAQEEQSSCPAGISERFFSDEELSSYLELYNGDVEKTAYQLLLRKSESTKLVISDMELPDQQAYFLRLAKSVRKNKGKSLEREDAP